MIRRRAGHGPTLAWGACVCAALACAAPAFATGVHADLVPAVATASPGDTIAVRLVIPVADDAFNAFDAAVHFDPTRLEFVPAATLPEQLGPVMTAACSNFFHLFTAHPDSLEIHLSMLCANTYVAGPGVVYQVHFRVLPPTGPTALSWGPGTNCYRAGLFVRPLDLSPGTLEVGSPAAVPAGVDAGGIELETPRPNPRRGAGGVTLSFRLPDPQRIRFDLFDTQGRRVATRDAEERTAGRGSFTWEGLRLSPGRYTVRMTSGAGARAERSWIVLR